MRLSDSVVKQPNDLSPRIFSLLNPHQEEGVKEKEKKSQGKTGDEIKGIERDAVHAIDRPVKEIVEEYRHTKREDEADRGADQRGFQDNPKQSGPQILF